MLLCTGGSLEVFLVVGGLRRFSFVVGSCSQRPRFRPNKGSAHNLAIGFDPAREY